MADRTIEAMTVVPARTLVDVRITLPSSHGGLQTGFRWQAPRDMSADEARTEIAFDLFERFLQSFLLTTPSGARHD